MTRQAVLLTAFLAPAAALAGCLAEDGVLEPTAADGIPPQDLSHLGAEGAYIVEDEGPLRVFKWRATSGPGASAPLVGPIRQVSWTQRFPFEVDPAVGFVEVSALMGGGDLALYVRDHEDKIQCGAATNRNPDSCKALVGPKVTAQETWAVEAVSTTRDRSNLVLTVTLHPRAHLDAILEEAKALEGALDRSVTFRNVQVAERGGEPTLGLLADGTIFYMAGSRTMRSEDAGATWTDVSAVLNQRFSLDPMLRVDPWTGRVFADQLTVACSNIAWTDDKGASWIEHPLACTGKVDDHQKLAVGGHPVKGNPVFDGVVYYAANSFSGLGPKGAMDWVARSFDGGVTWTTSGPALTDLTEADWRTNGPIEADRDGNVYFPAYLCDGGLAVVVSNDYGSTWTARRAGDKSAACEAIDPGMAIDSAGNAYAAWWGEGRVWLSYSKDKGATWAPQVPVSVPELRSQVLVDAAAGDAGRVAVAYLATPHSGAGPNRAPGYAVWHLYVSFTEDAFAAEPVWRTARVTPDSDPVQIGSICTSGIGCSGGNRNLLDFIDIQAGPDGRIYVAYTDGCSGTECTDPASSRARIAGAAVQDAVDGFRLFTAGAPWTK